MPVLDKGTRPQNAKRHGVLCVQRDEDQVRTGLRNQANRASHQEQKPVAAGGTPASLEELFVWTTRGQRGERPEENAGNVFPRDMRSEMILQEMIRYRHNDKERCC